MVRKQHKLLALLLCLLVAVSALASGMASVTAASGDVVYVRANNGWSNLHCYMWNGNGETKNADWPGVKMTSLGNNVYSYTLNGSYAKVIFNVGSSTNQTTDLSYPGTSGMIYDLSEQTWSQYTDAPQGTTSAADPQQPTTQAAVPSTGNIVYLKNTAGWSNPEGIYVEQQRQPQQRRLAGCFYDQGKRRRLDVQCIAAVYKLHFQR